ncbi:MAG TPA: methyltransferase domain-containing protein [Gemmatimonadales bacterium]|nr:methyltransferase domain-containing protein [Gemmatimonadales bacterium]
MGLRIASGQAEQMLLFGRNFFKHPRMLGSVIPSSRFLVRRLQRHVDWRRARVVVEFGPGVGTLTGTFLRHLAPDGRLVAIEMNREFVEYLTARHPDPRLSVVHGSASDVGPALARLGTGPADLVVSGIPYSTMTPALRDEILRATCHALRPGGQVLIYQFTRAVRSDLERVFGDVHQEFEPRNVLPAWIFTCTRNGKGCAD